MVNTALGNLTFSLITLIIDGDMKSIPINLEYYEIIIDLDDLQSITVK